MNFSDILDGLLDSTTNGDDYEYREQVSVRKLRDEVKRMRDRVSQTQDFATSAQKDSLRELDALQFNFSRTLLLLQALVQTLLRKKVISREELQAVIREFDLLDGREDNQLDPAAVPGMQPTPQRQSPGAALHDFASTLPDDPPGPQDYLKRLEEEST